MSGFAHIVPPSVLLSPKARSAYKTAAAGTKLFILVFSAIIYWSVGDSGSEMGQPASLVLRLLLFTGVMSFATLATAMETYLFKFDKSGGWAKTFWFVAMMVGLPFGFLGYFYKVYLPQTRPGPTTEEEKFSAAASA
jgi:apolipoprotein N-acyltransferase